MISTNQDFRQWRKHMGLNQQETAELLGLKSRMSISYIESGKKKITTVLALACENLKKKRFNEV